MKLHSHPQLKFQTPSSIPFRLVSTAISSCTPTFPSSPTLSVHPSFSAAPPTSRHYLVTHPPSKALPENLISFLYVVEHIAGKMQRSPPVLPHVPCELILELIIAGKDNNEIGSCRYSFLTFFIPLLICIWHLHFHGEVLDIIYEELFYRYHSLPFKPSEKILPVTLTLLFFSFILYILTGLFYER